MRPPELELLDELSSRARRIRERIVEACSQGEGGHLGGSMSLVEILVSLYFAELHGYAGGEEAPDRDVVLLSKGHGALALYATLVERGLLEPGQLRLYGGARSPLLTHPGKRTPGVAMPSGSLGHGLGQAVGFALAARLHGSPRRTYVVLGDGELQEGSVWESAACAAGLDLDNLVAIVDRNELQLTAGTETLTRLEPLDDRWHSFGWTVQRVPGHDLGALTGALRHARTVAGRPSVIIANTVKGKGVGFAAGRVACHYVRFNARQRTRALTAVGHDANGGRPRT
jgi:transketolase